MEANHVVDTDLIEELELVEEVLLENPYHNTVPYGEISNEFPYIDWVRVINNAENFFRHFYWPQKIGLVFVSGFPKKKLHQILSVVCFTGKVRVKVKNGEKGTCAYATYDEQYEGQLAVLLLNGLLYKGHEMKVLPCVNLFTEKLPEAIFKPVFNLDFFRDFSVETLRRLIQFFMYLWTNYNQQVKKRYLLGSSPIISDVEKCKEAIKQIKSHRARKVTLDCEGMNNTGGRISVLQIATPQMVYLFDIIAGGSKLFDEGGLRELLQDPGIMKITHDCRSDSIALFKEYNVRLEKVYDMQVAFAAYCTQDHGPIPIPVSLSTMLSKFGDGEFVQLKEMVKDEMTRDPDYWLQRPLTEQMIKYAQQDVSHLFIIYRNLKQQLTPASRSQIFYRSSLYARTWARRPAVHTCTPQVLTIPLYQFHDWDSMLISQFYGCTCHCTGSSNNGSHAIANSYLHHHHPATTVLNVNAMAMVQHHTYYSHPHQQHHYHHPNSKGLPFYPALASAV